MNAAEYRLSREFNPTIVESDEDSPSPRNSPPQKTNSDLHGLITKDNFPDLRRVNSDMKEKREFTINLKSAPKIEVEKSEPEINIEHKRRATVFVQSIGDVLQNLKKKMSIFETAPKNIHKDKKQCTEWETTPLGLEMMKIFKENASSFEKVFKNFELKECFTEFLEDKHNKDLYEFHYEFYERIVDYVDHEEELFKEAEEILGILKKVASKDATFISIKKGIVEKLAGEKNPDCFNNKQLFAKAQTLVINKFDEAFFNPKKLFVESVQFKDMIKSYLDRIENTLLWSEGYKEFKEKAKNFDTVLKNREVKNVFVDFLYKCRSPENFKFYVVSQMYANLDEKKRLEEAKNILATFISNDAPFQINLGGRYDGIPIINKIVETIGVAQRQGSDPGADLFVDAQKKAKSMIECDFFTSGNLFVNSSQFKDLIKITITKSTYNDQ